MDRYESLPTVSPEKRGSLWNACYAAAFMLEYPEKSGQLAAANVAAEMADIAVWALAEHDKVNT